MLKIHISNDCFEVINFAKKQLIKYLPQVCLCEFVNKADANFSIILKTEKEIEGVKYDGFKISLNPNTLEISSLSPRGVLYGVYDFLEKYFGVKFFAPDCELLPEKKQVVFSNESYISNPAFPLRSAWNAATYTDGEFYSKMRNHTMIKVNEEQYGGYCGWERVKEWGWGHNTLAYIPFKEYGSSYPQMFAYNRGEATDICFCNGVTDDGKKADDEVSCITVISNYIKRRIDEDSTLKYFNIGQSDSWVGFDNECNCERCKAARQKYKSSGVLIRFANIVADEVQNYVNKHYPGREVFIQIYAYSQTFNPPVKKVDGVYMPIDESVIPRDNVIVMLAQTSTDMSLIYPFYDEVHNYNSSEVYKGWLAILKRMHLWMYCVNFHEFFWYFPALKCIDGAIKEVVDKNCEAVSIQVSYADINDWQSLYKGYVASKLMWDPTLNANELLDEYLEGYYGVGAKYVREMMRLFDKHYYELGDSNIGFIVPMNKSDDVFMNANNYPKELIDKAEELLDLAEKEIDKESNDKEALLKRLWAVRLTPMRMKLYNYFYYEKDTSKIFDYYKKFRQYVDACNIKKYAEGKLRTFEELDWEIEQIGRLLENKFAAWDIYRYIYDGIVGNYQLPKRN